MSPELIPMRRDIVRACAFVLWLVVVSSMPSPAAQNSEPSDATTLRGCLRMTSEHAFVLIGQDRLGYVLDGDTKVLARHTDQEVEVAGTASAQTADDGPGTSFEEPVISSHNKKVVAVVSIPGLRNMQVASLTPLAGRCRIVPPPPPH